MTYEKRGTKRYTKEPSDSTAELITEQFLSSLVTQHPVKSISQFAGTHSYSHPKDGHYECTSSCLRT